MYGNSLAACYNDIINRPLTGHATIRKMSELHKKVDVSCQGLVGIYINSMASL